MLAICEQDKIFSLKHKNKVYEWVLFFKVQVYELSGLSDSSLQIYTKITRRYSPTTRGVSLKHEFCLLFLYAYSFDS